MNAIADRHPNERGGVMLYLLLPVILVAGAAGALYAFRNTEAVKPLKESLRPTLSKFGLMSATGSGAAAAGDQIASVTADELLSIDELYGDTTAPAVNTLDQIRKSNQLLGERNRQLLEDRRRLKEAMEAQRKREKFLGETIAKTEAEIAKLEEKDRERQNYLNSKRVQNIQDLSQTIVKVNPKNAASLLAAMWENPDPDDKVIVIETLRTLPGGKKSGIFDAMTKANPGAAAEILIQLVKEQEHDPQGAAISTTP